MRRKNSDIEVAFRSEGVFELNRTFFAYVPLSNYACYVIAEAYDDAADIKTERLAAELILENFRRSPSMKARKIKSYINGANEQLKKNCKSYTPEVSVLVIVSDYAAIRYASCGNAKLFVVSENQLSDENRTQTRYQTMLDNKDLFNDEYKDVPDKSEANNITQYLGKIKKLDFSVSAKTALNENSSVIMMTCGMWGRFSEGLILDAYSDAENNTEFVDKLEDALLSLQTACAIGGYAVASAAVKKTFKEDTAAKKKRKKIIIICSVILLAVALVLLCVWAIVRYNDRAALDEIIRLNTEGIQYSVYGNYAKSLERFQAANVRAQRLILWNMQFRREKRELISATERRFSILKAVEEGDALLEAKNYQAARRSYIYVNSESLTTAELELTAVSAAALRMINYFIEAANIVTIGEIYELSGLYANAILSYNQAFDLIRLTGDYEARKELLLRVIETERKLMDKQREHLDLFASEEDRQRQRYYESQMQRVGELNAQAAQARALDDFAEAKACYEQIIQIFNDMGIVDERVERVYRAIAELELQERNMASLEDERQMNLRIAGLTSQALEADAAGSYAMARFYYEEIARIYIDAGISDERLLNIYARIAEIGRLERQESLE